RGTADNKFMAATFVANLIRYKQEGYRPDRDIIVALETDEEIGDAKALGIRWLINNHRDLIDAAFALNEGGSVGLKDGKPIRNGLQTSEKVTLFYRLEALNKGGHSSLPSPDNGIRQEADEGYQQQTRVKLAAAEALGEGVALAVESELTNRRVHAVADFAPGFEWCLKLEP